jgi:hypothetical protein
LRFHFHNVAFRYRKHPVRIRGDEGHGHAAQREGEQSDMTRSLTLVLLFVDLFVVAAATLPACRRFLPQSALPNDKQLLSATLRNSFWHPM